MAYQKHTWVTKEIIRREYLQNIEDGIYNEEQRAIEEETALGNRLTGERDRAVAKENEIATNLSSEITRATNAEGTLTSNLNDEVTRATAAESALATDLAYEIERNNALRSDLTSEVTRAQTAESNLQTYVDQKIATTYKPCGTIVFADLPALVAANQGNVYDISDAFTTTADFVEGAGKNYPAGTNVAIVVNGNGYKYDVLPGFIDTSKFYSTEDTAEATIADDDYVPYFDSSANAKKKSLWSTIVAKIKAAFGIASGSSTTLFLRKDGTWAEPPGQGGGGTITSITAGAGLAGGTITSSGTIKADLKSETKSTLAAADKGTTASREYAVGLDVNGKLSVNVPWSNTTYSSGTGLSLSGTTFNISTVPVANGGTGATTAANARTNLGIGTVGTLSYGSDTTKFLRNDGTWVVPPNSTYNFSGVSFYSGNSATATHDANAATANGNYYYSSNGPATSIGASTADGALYVQSYSDSWVGQIAQDYRNGNIFVRGKNNGTWQAWKKPDAGTLQGAAPAETATGSTIVKRNSSGYIYATYYNQSSAAETPTTSSYMVYCNSDGWFRKSSLANVKTILGLGSAAYTNSTAYAAASHTHNYAGSSSAGGNANWADKLILAGMNVASTRTDTFVRGSINLDWFTETGKISRQPGQYGYLLTLGQPDYKPENHQIWANQDNGSLFHRGTNGASYTNPPAFREILDTGNVGTYAIPNSNSGITSISSFDNNRITFNITLAGVTRYLQFYLFNTSDNVQIVCYDANWNKIWQR